LKITTNTTTNPGLHENENNFIRGKIMRTLKRKTVLERKKCNDRITVTGAETAS